LGLGLNVNEESFDEKLPNPTSLRILTEKEWNLERVWSAIEINLRIYYNLLADRKFNLLHEEYEQMLYKRKDSMTLLLSSNAEYKGQILGVNERGQLKFLHNGDLLLFNFHEVRFL
jgi:BirA family biotin operon repressor/biotin-[acetyl-CoA-carboxylase] ligase